MRIVGAVLATAVVYKHELLVQLVLDLGDTY
jgi:hypothetical protein